MIKFRIIETLIAGFFFCFGLLLVSSLASATPFMPDSPIPPTPTIEKPDFVNKHPGKEFTDEKDRTAKTPERASRERNHQTIAWDGKGGTKDSTMFPAALPRQSRNEIDALAFEIDTLFTEVSTNATAILFSTRGGDLDQGKGTDMGATRIGQLPERNCLTGAPVCFETTAGIIGTWATDTEVDNMPPPGLTNLDALEVWGPTDTDNANKFSISPEFFDLAPSIVNANGTTYLSHRTLVAAVLPFFPGATSDDIDLDALMVNDKNGVTSTFGQGDQILFSLWPDSHDLIVGDEVFLWTFGDDIDFLNHGGHRWNSNWLGLNVDALEAAAKPKAQAPEPTTLALIGLGLAGLGFARRRRLHA